jgi:hypothetical protein
MPEPTTEHDGQPQHPEVRYEHSDASFGKVTIVIGAITCLGVIIFAVVWLVFARLWVRQDAMKKSPYPLAAEPSEALPAGPRLEQIDRLAGIKTPNIYVRESERLKVRDSYGPAEEEDFVRIPIERARQMLADKLPARKEPPAQQRKRAEGLLNSGASNSGRMFRGGAR